MLEAERGGDVVEIGHGAHVDPGLRHRDDDIGKAEAEPLDQHDASVGLRNHLAHQILAGDAEMHRALRELRGDFGGREISDLDAVEAGNGAAIIARAARLDQLEPGAREKAFRVFLQPAFRRNREDERRAHDAPPLDREPLDPGGKADRRDRLVGAEPREQAVIASARDQRILPVRVGSCSSNTKPV